MTAHNTINLIARRFGALTVLHREGRIRGYAAWRCRCDCGVELVVRGDWLRLGKKKTCSRAGHFLKNRKEKSLSVQFGAEYYSWRGMRERCNNPNNAAYHRYGGRGIKVCARWHDFALFLQDMGTRPTEKHTLDRENVNGNYELGNCRWATKGEQVRNMRTTVRVQYQGKEMLLLDLVEQMGINRSTVDRRLRNGWSIDEALSVPVRKQRPRKSIL